MVQYFVETFGFKGCILNFKCFPDKLSPMLILSSVSSSGKENVAFWQVVLQPSNRLVEAYLELTVFPIPFLDALIRP